MNKILCLIALFAGLSTLPAADPLERLLADSALKTASVGFAMIPLDDPKATEASEEESEEKPEKTEAEEPIPSLLHNPDLALTPASVQKAITTATALQILGPDYKFQTRLYRNGDNFIVKGGGDPLLASTSVNAEFTAWHKALVDAKITEIKGTLIADSSYFEDRTTPNQWLWGDIGNYYGAGPCGLNFHRNSYEITFQPGKSGSPAKLLSTYPKPPGVTFQNEMKTGTSSSGDQGYVYSGPKRELVTFRGTVPAGGKFTIKGSLPNPPLSCVSAFRDFLKKKDISVNAISVQKTSPSEDDLIHTTESPTLAKLVIPTNQKSINLNAECIFKALTPSGTTAASQKALTAHWKKQGVDLTGFLAHDGSGLSPRMRSPPAKRPKFSNSFPTPSKGPPSSPPSPWLARSGTLRSFGSGTSAAGRVVAKTGSMERVRAWAGYLVTKSGQKYAFALFINHYNGSDRAVRNAAARLLSTLCAE